MSTAILKRLLGMIPTLVAISVMVFVLIQLPPGDILSSKIEELEQQGLEINEERIQALRKQYNMDATLPVQYFRWISGCLVGDFGGPQPFNRSTPPE